MPALSLRSLLSPRSSALPTVKVLQDVLGEGICILDPSGKPIFGESNSGNAAIRVPVKSEDTHLGFVTGPAAAATALASLITYLAARETESRALAAEVLHLYREVHLIEQLSEQLAPLLNVPAVCQSALSQAQRLIRATSGSILAMEKAGDSLKTVASLEVAHNALNAGPLPSDSQLAASVLERGMAEIINDCASDPRALESERTLGALICAPLRSGQRTVGIIALANSTPGETYSAADLKLLNTIALQTAAAMENSMLCAEMVDSASERAAFAAELHAASTVQQLLLQSASRPTPGFHVDSVYMPASEVGGDFFLVSSGPDGSVTAIVGDVAGKGLTAAMRVAMILGVLRRETSHNPGEILSALNDALATQDQLGFTTACCIRISLTGNYILANAGHISPYLSGRELETPPALPLGIVADQTYQQIEGNLGIGECLVLLSDGVLEARAQGGELFGFERLQAHTLKSAREIAQAAQDFGQEDDITVLTLSLAAI